MDEDQKRIGITIQADFDDALYVPRRGAFVPELLSTA
jgi:hypothetical protein